MVFCNMNVEIIIYKQKIRHNPYFNRWFSAMSYIMNMTPYRYKSQSLF